MTASKKHFEMRKAGLITERSSFMTHWQELAEWVIPTRGRFTISDRNSGRKRGQKIINSAATMALRTLSSGMMAGITSPARPWFRLATPDRDMMEYAPVKVWLGTVELIMRDVFSQSNLYNVLPVLYRELGQFGTAAMSVVRDYKDVVRFHQHTVGSYMIGQDDRLVVDTIYREFERTVGQLVGRYVYDGNPRGDADWSRVSPEVKTLWDRGTVDAWVPVVHACEPNDRRDLRLLDSKNKPFRSAYYEPGRNDDGLLNEAGFDEFPAMSVRWDVTGEDIYGTDCPGMIALGDVKALQILEKRKAQAIDKLVNPPLKGPPSLRNVPISSLPGGVTIYDSDATKEGLSALYQVDPKVRELMLDSQQTVERINSVYFADLFLMFAMSDRREITAREVDERHEEKLLTLGPVLERLHGELLNPIIDRTFNIMVQAGILPPPPEELQGKPLKVEYISLLAQAQRAVGTAGIERLSGFIAGLAEVNQDVIDKFDMDQAVDEYGEMIGVSPKIIRPDDKVAEIRAARAQQAQAANALAAAEPAANAIAKLAGAKMDGQDVLSRATGL